MVVLDRQNVRRVLNIPATLSLLVVSLWLVSLGFLSPVTADDRGENSPAEVVTLTRIEPWTTVFAGSEVRVPCRIRAQAPFRGRLLWGLAVDGKIPLARGEKAIDLAAGEETDVDIELAFPALKPGVVMSTQLGLQLVPTGQLQSIAAVEETITVFTDNPFFDRSEWLADLQLHLYDPTGQTIALFERLELPFDEVSNVALLDDLGEGVLIVGEGVSFREERRLPELLVALASRGVSVISLAPSEGTLLLPSGGLASAASLSFQNASAIRRLDRRLDAVQWMSQPVQPVSTIVLDRQGAQVVGEIDADPSGWSWIELQFDANEARPSPSRCVVCCFPLVEKWDDGPTPRFLLARLLEYVTFSKPSAPQ